MTKTVAQQLRLLAQGPEGEDRFSAAWMARQPMPAAGLHSYDGILYRAAFYALYCLGQNPKWRGCNAQMTTFWWDGENLQAVTLKELRRWEVVQFRWGMRLWRR